MSDFDYYAAPSDEVFNEVKRASMELWQTYDDTYGYATEKTDRIKGIKNIRDNAWYIVAMFDPENQARLLESLEEPARSEVERMLEWSRTQ